MADPIALYASHRIQSGKTTQRPLKKVRYNHLQIISKMLLKRAT
jgi:hypothetical protein